ncbi:MAG: polysaccharide pyruvyl transferase family protein [Parvibaculum sp.]|uniref:polysaccharide pyruvyl transferase family protein n=1 Tax=Parvibaculum sp. TaxID=2024848 RepID=UPI0025D8D48E|nr:polysaccharide pyruvyl transferase family protein [Parvibaculum sp.]MCE9650960.1 polysaccharide pyruvyl transferase family protein [Parvibaculum sp.]
MKHNRIEHVLITNAIALNGGDAAILTATVEILRQSFGENLNVVVHDMAATASGRYHPEFTFRNDIHSEVAAWSRGRVKPALAAVAVLVVARLMRFAPGSVLTKLLPPPLRATLDDYANADIVVSSGGTYLVPHYSLVSKLLDFLMTMAFGKPLVLFTQSLGPFKPIRHRRLLRYLLRRAALILVRDERSRDHLDELGVPRSRVRLCADAAFALARADLPERTFPPARERWRIAISVRDWPHFEAGARQDGMERYFSAMTTLVCALTERWGAEVTFLSTCQGTPEYWTDDSRTAEEIFSRLPEQVREHVVVDRSFRQPRRLIAELSTYDLTIATRLHAAILSLCAKTPVLPISYEFKTTELFRQFGLGNATVDIENISPDTILAAFETAVAFWTESAEEAWAKVADARNSAFGAGPLIASALGKAVRESQAVPNGSAFQARD